MFRTHCMIMNMNKNKKPMDCTYAAKLSGINSLKEDNELKDENKTKITVFYNKNSSYFTNPKYTFIDTTTELKTIENVNKELAKDATIIDWSAISKYGLKYIKEQCADLLEDEKNKDVLKLLDHCLIPPTSTSVAFNPWNAPLQRHRSYGKSPSQKSPPKEKFRFSNSSSQGSTASGFGNLPPTPPAEEVFGNLSKTPLAEEEKIIGFGPETSKTKTLSRKKGTSNPNSDDSGHGVQYNRGMVP